MEDEPTDVRTGQVKLNRGNKLSADNENKGNFIFPVELTTKRIGDLNLLKTNLPNVMSTHTRTRMVDS